MFRVSLTNKDYESGFTDQGTLYKMAEKVLQNIVELDLQMMEVLCFSNTSEMFLDKFLKCH